MINAIPYARHCVPFLFFFLSFFFFFSFSQLMDRASRPPDLHYFSQRGSSSPSQPSQPAISPRRPLDFPRDWLRSIFAKRDEGNYAMAPPRWRIWNSTTKARKARQRDREREREREGYGRSGKGSTDNLGKFGCVVSKMKIRPDDSRHGCVETVRARTARGIPRRTGPNGRKFRRTAA